MKTISTLLLSVSLVVFTALLYPGCTDMNCPPSQPMASTPGGVFVYDYDPDPEALHPLGSGTDVVLESQSSGQNITTTITFFDDQGQQVELVYEGELTDDHL